MINFPLILSCGHYAKDNCSCWRDSRISKTPNGDSPIDRVLRDFNGSWRATLESYGARLPSGKHHGPCPVCGGKDRFRFDDKNGRGTWFCSQCEPQSGGGLLLLSRYLGKPTIDVAKELLGDCKSVSVAPKRYHTASDDEIRKANQKAAKQAAQNLAESAFFSDHEYMTKKGLRGNWMLNGDTMINSSGELIEPGDLLLVPCFKNGEIVNVQKITADGKKRPIFGGDMQGVYHLIDGHEKLIAIAEGYATGVTVNRLTGAKTYVAFNTGNLSDVSKYAREQHKNAKIVIFADHDEIDPVHEWRPGTKYAEEAAIPVSATIALPGELGDWDDYRQKYGDEKTKQAMRDAIRRDEAKFFNQKAEQASQESKAQAKPMKIEPQQHQKSQNEPKPIQPQRLDSKAQNKASESVKLSTLDLLDISDIDVDHPPGLAGEIVDYVRNGANRELQGGAYTGMALQAMAMAGAGLRGYRGVKLSLITLTLGISAAGKERPQSVIKELLAACGKTIYGDIRSDKDVIRAAVYDNGKCFYVYDEAHRLLDSDKKNQHTANVVDLLMELATTSRYQLSQLHRDEFLEKLNASRARTEKMIAAKEEAKALKNPDMEAGEIKAIELDIERLKQTLETFDAREEALRTGVKNPALHLLAYSTPQKLASIVDEDKIESGFLGRALIFDCGVERAEQIINWDEEPIQSYELDPKFEYLKTQIGLIDQMACDVAGSSMFGEGFKFQPTPEALEVFKAIHAKYDSDEYRNHQRAGAIYARLVERVLSLSSIMALGNIKQNIAVIEPEHVKFALSVVLRSVDRLMSILRVNEASEHDDVEIKIDGIREVIIRRLTLPKNDKQDGWRYKSQIKDHLKRQKYYQTVAKACREANQDAFENAIATAGGQIQTDPTGKKIRLRSHGQK